MEKKNCCNNNDDKKIEIALDYLEKNRLLHIDMIEPIRRNTCDILYAHNDGVLIHEKNSNSYMITTDSVDLARKLIENLPKKGLFVIHQKELFCLVKNKFNYKNYFECKQSAYLKNTAPKLSDNIEIKLLVDKDKSIVKENYKSMDEDFDYTSFLIDENSMWGAFDSDILMGFIGIHSEGSIGLLEVLPEHRNKGVAQALQKYLIDYMLRKEYIPFGQVVIGNDKSLNLQRKLGLEISEESVFWLY